MLGALRSNLLSGTLGGLLPQGGHSMLKSCVRDLPMCSEMIGCSQICSVEPLAWIRLGENA
eukprot:COSAG04_NODE_31518_length_256_cov_0.898089_1_plen_60_part_01